MDSVDAISDNDKMAQIAIDFHTKNVHWAKETYIKFGGIFPVVLGLTTDNKVIYASIPNVGAGKFGTAMKIIAENMKRSFRLLAVSFVSEAWIAEASNLKEESEIMALRDLGEYERKSEVIMVETIDRLGHQLFFIAKVIKDGDRISFSDSFDMTGEIGGTLGDFKLM
jgi:hypothetical protein